MHNRISIAGDIGSGKTTVAHRLAKIVGTDVLSTGGIQRKLAQDRGVTVLELNRLAETDASIDRDIDRYLIEMRPGKVVVESRMAWHFVPDTTKVYLYCSAYEATRRIVGANRKDEDYSNTADPLRPILDRRLSEVFRYKKYYNVDINELRNYDLVVDTTFSSVDEIVDRVAGYAAGPVRPVCWVSPRSLIPTRTADVSAARLEALQASIGKEGFDAGQPIRALYVDHVFYIHEGHGRTGAALKLHQPLLPVEIVGYNDEPLPDGRTARQFVRDSVSDDLIHAWEAALGFTYTDRIWQGEA